MFSLVEATHPDNVFDFRLIAKARVILHSYRVDVMVSSLSPYVQEILQSAAFAEELKNLKDEGSNSPFRRRLM